MLLIPSIDLRQGRCIRLLQGSFGAETRYEQPPDELLSRYRSCGASWLHIVDLDGAQSGIMANQSLIVTLAARRMVRLQVGGGIRCADTAEELLRNGVDRVVIGSAAAERPDEVARWLTHFGADRVCLAFDVKLDDDAQPRVRTRGWTAGADIHLWDAIRRFPAGSIKHVLCTDVARDGTLSGPNVELYRHAVSGFPELSWQASGGIRDAADLVALAATGVAAAVSGKALLEHRIPTEELRPFLPDASSPASTSATVAS